MRKSGYTHVIMDKDDIRDLLLSLAGRMDNILSLRIKVEERDGCEWPTKTEYDYREGRK